jgi:hypothetical protein
MLSVAQQCLHDIGHRQQNVLRFSGEVPGAALKRKNVCSWSSLDVEFVETDRIVT